MLVKANNQILITVVFCLVLLGAALTPIVVIASGAVRPPAEQFRYMPPPPPQPTYVPQGPIDPNGVLPSIWIDRDGCHHWVADGGLEGYMVHRVNPVTGLPVCGAPLPGGAAQFR
jgi:hypothetical protein